MSDIEKYNLEYVPNKRFVVRIEDKVTKRVFFTKRIRLKKTAIVAKSNIHFVRDFIVTIFDTKTGEEVAGKNI